MSEPTGHQGDSTVDVSPHEHCSRNETRKMLTSFKNDHLLHSAQELSSTLFGYFTSG